MTRIAFSWNSLPQYAARLLRGALDEIGGECLIIGSRPTVPMEGIERALRQKIHWVDANKTLTWSELELDVPAIFFQSGWSYHAFSALGQEVKQWGGRVIGLSDANWRGDFRQLVLGPIGFRLRHRRHFDAMLVPGKQGVRLLRWFGMPADSIHTGMYGADPALFGRAPKLSQRPKTFLFVGQFIERKQVVALAEAFIRSAGQIPEWSLHIIGGGEQKALIPRHPRILIEDFVQPEQLVQRFAEARFFILPSLVEAWGLVVHEATLSGCGLILSDAIGSADDLCTSVNGIRFGAGNGNALAQALLHAARFDERMLDEAETESLRLAGQFSPKRFGREVKSLVDKFFGV
jgi:glycosyltransferase involved in cell wall biosynthesis